MTDIIDMKTGKKKRKLKRRKTINTEKPLIEVIDSKNKHGLLIAIVPGISASIMHSLKVYPEDN